MEVSRPCKICGLISNSRDTSLVIEPVSAVIINQEMNNAKLRQQALTALKTIFICFQNKEWAQNPPALGNSTLTLGHLLTCWCLLGQCCDWQQKRGCGSCCLDYHRTLQIMRHGFNPARNRDLNHGKRGWCVHTAQLQMLSWLCCCILKVPNTHHHSL